MSKKDNISATTPNNNDGKLTPAKALEVLQNAYTTANEALPKALRLCQKDEERFKVQDDCNTVKRAYIESLEKTIVDFKKVADDLEKEAGNVRQKATELKNVQEAIGLFTDLVRLATALALAFG